MRLSLRDLPKPGGLEAKLDQPRRQKHWAGPMGGDALGKFSAISAHDAISISPCMIQNPVCRAVEVNAIDISSLQGWNLLACGNACAATSSSACLVKRTRAVK